MNYFYPTKPFPTDEMLLGYRHFHAKCTDGKFTIRLVQK